MSPLGEHPCNEYFESYLQAARKLNYTMKSQTEDIDDAHSNVEYQPKIDTKFILDRVSQRNTELGKYREKLSKATNAMFKCLGYKAKP